ncbi:hypothetical protein EMCRGX_G006258 [Ephydatia muelleri]
MGNLTLECGVQQGDPLGPLLFSLVLNILVSEIVLEPGCANLLYHAWYLDDGVVAGSSTEIEEVGALDPQVALMLLRTCSGFCKLSHLARATPPSLSVKALELFDQDARSCLSQSTSVDLTDVSWNQLLTLPPFVHPAMASTPVSYPPHPCCGDVQCCVAPADKISLDSLASSNINQKMLSSKLDDYQLQGIFNRSSVAVHRHNLLRDVFADSCRLAHLPVKLEVGNNLTPDHDHSRPADVLVHNWSLGKPAAFDFCVTSPLNSLILSEAGVSSGVAAQASEIRKHNSNDAKCVGLCS